MTSSVFDSEEPCRRVVLTHGSARAVVSIYGAHVIEWSQDGGTTNLLFLSDRAVLDGSRPIRGGIPLIFPQFGGRGAMQSHGFARNMVWQVDHTSTDDVSSSVCLSLRSSDATRAHWPRASFVTEYTVTLTTSGLRCAWMVRNTSTTDDLAFHAALHTYFAVDDIVKCSVRGALTNSMYIDQLAPDDDGKREMTQQSSDAITFEVGEVDRIYTQVADELTVVDGRHRVHIVKNGFPDAVIWNPHIEKAKRMAADFGPEEWRRMVCVEAGTIVPGQVLRASGEWTGVLELYTRA